MESTHEEGNTRGPKRQALASTHSIAATPVVEALDVAIWTSIIEFLPVPKSELVEEDDFDQTWDASMQYDDAAVSEVVATWRTLLNLRLVTKELATLLHPVNNKVLWKRLLLQTFDFSVGETWFNPVNDLTASDFENDDEDEDEDEDEERGQGWKTAVVRGQTDEANPQLVAIRDLSDDMPEEYLEETLMIWSKMGIYHRPSQYGFLTTLQQQPAVGAWPETEDAFTLFGDLVRLLMLPHGGNMQAGGEALGTTIKYLVAPTEGGSSSPYYRYYVMKTLGYSPQFWHRGSGISKEWSGFTAPDRFEATIMKQLINGRGRDNTNGWFKEDGDASEFPSCTVGNAKRLYQHLHQHCRDWRSVCCNEGVEGETPVFFVGESKSHPHRWIGDAGMTLMTG